MTKPRRWPQPTWNFPLSPPFHLAQVFSFGLPTVLIPDSAFEPLQVDPSDPRTAGFSRAVGWALQDIVKGYAGTAAGSTWLLAGVFGSLLPARRMGCRYPRAEFKKGYAGIRLGSTGLIRELV